MNRTVGLPWAASRPLSSLAAMILLLFAQPGAVPAEPAGEIAIQGTVRSEDGTPLENLEVSARTKGSDEVARRARTASNGAYAIGGLPLAEYAVSVDADMAVYECGKYEVKTGEGPGQGVIVMDWVLCKKGETSRVCCGAVKGPPFGIAGIVPAGPAGAAAGIPGWIVAAGAVGGAGAVTGAVLGGLCAADEWPCQDKKESASPSQ